MNIGSSNMLNYDNCAYQQRLAESTSPLAYNLMFKKFENCDKCLANGFFVKFQPEIVDAESELLNITRPNSRCNNFKYNPNCTRSELCTSTFDKRNPIVLAPEVCPIIYNNIPRMTTNGIVMPSMDICRK